MNLDQRIAAFSALGNVILRLPPDEFELLAQRISNENPWFTAKNVELALKGLGQFLNEGKLRNWTAPYHFENAKSVGIVMAGNIPLVGFHDFLSVLVAGHRVHVKLSSQDSLLMKFIIQQLTKIEPSFESLIVISEQLKSVDAIIATGSDNTARYFEYYFRNIPHIIRKNRSSCAIIMGEEPSQELHELGKDVFSYFGLGCRNVAKLFIPSGYDLKRVLDSWEPYSEIRHHHKYINNYDYQKSIMLLNQTPFLDNGFVMLTQGQQLVSPISVIFWEEYNHLNELQQKIDDVSAKLQCVVAAKAWYKGSFAFGQAQFPSLTDYADNIDTLKFLEFRV